MCRRRRWLSVYLLALALTASGALPVAGRGQDAPAASAAPAFLLDPVGQEGPYFVLTQEPGTSTTLTVALGNAGEAEAVARTYAKLVVSDDARTLLGGVLVGDTSAYATLRPLVGLPLPAEPGSLIDRALAEGARVGYEIDHADSVSESGWSVLVRGAAGRVTDAEILAAVADTDVHPWAPTARNQWIEIRAE